MLAAPHDTLFVVRLTRCRYVSASSTVEHRDDLTHPPWVFQSCYVLSVWLFCASKYQRKLPWVARLWGSSNAKASPEAGVGLGNMFLKHEPEMRWETESNLCKCAALKGLDVHTLHSTKEHPENQGAVCFKRLMDVAEPKEILEDDSTSTATVTLFRVHANAVSADVCGLDGFCWRKAHCIVWGKQMLMTHDPEISKLGFCMIFTQLSKDQQIFASRTWLTMSLWFTGTQHSDDDLQGNCTVAWGSELLQSSQTVLHFFHYCKPLL